MQRDQERRRDEHDEIRRGERMDAAPRERYGNEEDPYSREYRRAYPEQRLERRLHNDAPYNRPGYEPEMGRPGGRENVDLDTDRNRTRSGDRYDDRGLPGQPSQRHAFETSGEDWTDDSGQDFPGQGGYYGQGQRYGERPSFGQQERERSSQRQQYDQRQQYGQRGDQGRSQRVWQSGYSSGRPASPYEQGDLGSWYGGDTGMGDSGSSLDRPNYGQGGYGQGGYGQGGYGQSRSPFSIGQFGGGQQGRHEQRGPVDKPVGGRFSGRGPRGYQRSDERIREDVCELLTAHGEIDASSMEVEVRQGTVTLRGSVDSGRIRRLTEEVIEEIPGVRDVENQLRVTQRTGPSEQLTGAGQRTSDGASAPQTTPAYGVGVTETSGVSSRSGPGEPGISAGAGPSQHGNRWQIRETMDVIGSDGESVGAVTSVRGTDFLVNRPRERDLYVPFSAVQTVDSERVMLSCRASEVDRQNWPAASLTGGA